jgi:FMN reductase
MSMLVISCSLNPGSRSRQLALAAVDELKRLGEDVSHLALRHLDLPHCDGDKAYGAPDVTRVQSEIEAADAILLATPVYNYDVNAAAKNMVELTGRAWTDKLVGFLVAAGGQGSYMSVMGLANSLMLDFRCLIIPRFVYATGDDFAASGQVDPAIADRIRHLCSKAVSLASALRRVAD